MRSFDIAGSTRTLLIHRANISANSCFMNSIGIPFRRNNRISLSSFDFLINHKKGEKEDLGNPSRFVASCSYELSLLHLCALLQNFKGFPSNGKTVLKRANNLKSALKTKQAASEKSSENEHGLEKQRSQGFGDKLKVCFVTSFPPNRARLSEYANNLLQKLVDLPSIGKIYVLADYSPISRSCNDEKLEIRPIWKHDNPLSILKVLFEIIKLRPDVVHFNVHFQSFGKSRIANFMGLCLPFLTKLFRKKSLVTIHNFGEKVNLSVCGLNPSLLNRIGIKIATKLVAMSDFVTVTVPSYINYLRNNYGCKSVTYIPHGTYVDDLDPISFNLNPHPNPGNVILMFGHMAPYKGLSVMLEAFQELLKERDDIELVIAGNDHPNFPGYLESFRRKKLPRVEFLGYVEEEEVPKVFEKATIVVLPYLTATGTSGVFHLACGFGKPIVASDLPEIRELIKEGASAILIRPGDVEELKRAIVKLLDNPELRKEIGLKNYSFAQKESWEEIARKFEEVYCKLSYSS